MKHTQQAHPMTATLAVIAVVACVAHFLFTHFTSQVTRSHAGPTVLGYAEINFVPAERSHPND